MRINWETDEAVALFDLYFRSGGKAFAPRDEVEKLSFLLRNRAKLLGYDIDSKFRNVAGIKRQLACVHSVVTNGAEGLPHTSKLFQNTYKLYQEDPERFAAIHAEFNSRYS